MADVSNELIYEVLKSMQERSSRMEDKLDELKAEMNAFRGHMISLQQDIHNIYGVLSRQDLRLDRIERRLEMVEPAAG